MIEINNLCKDFGSLCAVDHISFRVERGEVLGFLGPNGAGKSTTMKMITGFLPPTSGSVQVSGYDVGRQPIQAKSCIGYLPEGAPLYPDMTPGSFLEFIADVRGLPRASKEARIREVTDLVNIDSVMHQRIDTLSKGYKRRVGIAQAILHDPEVLILDEPTDGLDPNQKYEVRELIQRMAPNKVIVLSTHILEEVEAVCTRAIIIAKGRILFDGTPDELQSRSRCHNAVSISLPTALAETALEQLRALQGVSAVEAVPSSNGITSYRIVPDTGERVLAAVNQLARDEAWEVDQVFVEQGRLDEVFREITTAADSAARS